MRLFKPKQGTSSKAAKPTTASSVNVSVLSTKHSKTQDGASSAVSTSPSQGKSTSSGKGTPIVTSQRNLWKEAYDSLHQTQRDLLQAGMNKGQVEVADTIENVIDLTKKGYKDYCTQGWHIGKSDDPKETSVRIRAKEILCSTLRFKNLIDQGLKYDPSGYGTAVWSLLAGGLQMIQNDTDRVEAVFKSVAEIAKLLPKYAVVESQYRDRALQQQTAFEDAIVEVYGALLSYAAEARKGLDKSVISRVTDSFTSSKGQTITLLHDDLMKKDTEAEKWLTLVGQQQRKIEFSILEEQAKQATQSLNKIDAAVKKVLELERNGILEWLFPTDSPTDRSVSSPNPSIIQQSLRIQVERDNATSGQWFLNSTKFSDWKQDSTSFLWISGLSGCGKSSLCSTVIKHLAELTLTSKDKTLAYWYFDNRNKATQSLETFLRSLLRQIGAVDDVIPEPIRTLVAKNKGPGSSPGVQELSKALRDSIENLEQDIFIVVDAVDEYPADERSGKRQDLLTVICDLVKPQLANIHILITSIDEYDIRKTFNSKGVSPVEVNVEPLLSHDLGSFVDTTIARIAADKSWWNDKITAKVDSVLKADDFRRFRIVALHLDDLEDCWNEGDVDKTLSSIPTTVEEMYYGRLSKIAGNKVDRLCHILKWIFVAERQLSPKELAAAPKVNLPNPDDIFKICPRGMIMKAQKRELQPNPKRGNDRDIPKGKDSRTNLDAMRSTVTNEIVVFDHPSVRRFLSSQTLLKSSSALSDYFVDEQKAQSELTRLTLKYLLTVQESEVSSDFLDSNPFLSYAADHLTSYLRHGSYSETDDDHITELLLKLFSAPMQTCFLNWMRIADPLKSGCTFDTKPSSSPSPLYVAIEMKLHKVSRHLVSHNWFINSEGGPLSTPLHLALFQKDFDLALKLIEKGANPSRHNSNGVSPLFVATELGSKDIMQGLLAAGADVNGKEAVYGNVLQLACYQGNLEIVKLLIEHKADVNAEAGFFGTALQAAAAVNNGEIVTVLLDNKALPNTNCGSLGNAIQAAVTGGHDQVLQQLIAGGAKFDAKGDTVWTEALENFNASTGGAPRLALFMKRPEAVSSQTKLSNSQKIMCSLLQSVKLNNLWDQLSAAGTRLENAREYSKLELELQTLTEEIRTEIQEGRHRSGYFARIVYLVTMYHCLTSVKRNLKDYKETVPELRRVYGIVQALRESQEVIENDESGVYTVPRKGLVGLYENVLHLVRMYQNSLVHPMFNILLPLSPRWIQKHLQALLEQNEKFLSAMHTADVIATSAQIRSLESRMTKAVHDEIQRVESTADQRLQVALHDMERRIMDMLHKKLPEIVREEVLRTLQGMNIEGYAPDGRIVRDEVLRTLRGLDIEEFDADGR